MLIPQRFKTSDKTYYLMLAILGFILVLPLIDTRIIPGHDFIFHISRIENTATALKAGIFPVRMFVDPVLFWGSPIGIFYPGLFYYIPAILKLAGIPIEICYNIFIALIFFFGLFAAEQGFLILNKSKVAGFLSATLYLSSGYFLFDVYSRNALGEALSLAFMPLAIACTMDIINKNKVPIRRYFFLIISFSAIIESHVLSSIFLTLFCIVYLAVNRQSWSLDKLKHIFLLSLFIFMLNASFIIPFLMYYLSVSLNVNYIDNFANSGIPVKSLWSFLTINNMGLFSGICVFLLTKHHITFHSENTHTKVQNYSQYLLIAIFFIFASSILFPWNYLSPLKEIFKFMQFPWRFLGFATLCLCVCGGFGLQILLQRTNCTPKLVAATSIMICMVHLVPFFIITSSLFAPPTEKCYWNRTPFVSDFDYLRSDVDLKTLYAQGNNYISDAQIRNWKKQQTNITFNYTAQSDCNIILPLVNYPGYVAKKHSGQEITITENSNHMVTLNLPKGNDKLYITYEGLTVFKVADYTSLISLTILIFLTIWIYKQKMWNKLI